jgi:Fe-S cluster biogenesis protein NfuA
VPGPAIAQIPEKSAGSRPAYVLLYRISVRSTQMVSRDQIESVLSRIRPLMQADGGDIELVDVRDNNAHVRLTGMCAGCPSAHMTLYMGVEMALRDEIKDFQELVVV